MTLDEWYRRYGVPMVHDDFRNDAKPPDWLRSQFSITPATPADARRAGCGVPQDGERLCRLSRLVSIDPVRLCTVTFVVDGSRVQLLKAANDRELLWLWEQLICAGIRPVIVTEA